MSTGNLLWQPLVSLTLWGSPCRGSWPYLCMTSCVTSPDIDTAIRGAEHTDLQARAGQTPRPPQSPPLHSALGLPCQAGWEVQGPHSLEHGAPCVSLTSKLVLGSFLLHFALSINIFYHLTPCKISVSKKFLLLQNLYKPILGYIYIISSPDMVMYTCNSSVLGD